MIRKLKTALSQSVPAAAATGHYELLDAFIEKNRGKELPELTELSSHKLKTPSYNNRRLLYGGVSMQSNKAVDTVAILFAINIMFICISQAQAVTYRQGSTGSVVRQIQQS